MIVVTLSPQHLEVVGHADDPLVCASVGAMLMTLHKGYGAPDPDDGYFRVELSWDTSPGVDFCRKAFVWLAELQPNDITLRGGPW